MNSETSLLVKQEHGEQQVMQPKVAAVVVTFNRKELLIECVDALLMQTRQLDKIIVFDNASSDGTSELVHAKGYVTHPDIMYVLSPENLGGAGGFRAGMRIAFEAGYDWIWIMDDDTEAEPDAVKFLLKAAYADNVKAICPLVIDRAQVVQNCHNKQVSLSGKQIPAVGIEIPVRDDERSIKIDANAFVGPMFHRDVIAAVGYPDTKYFTCGDDTEYTLRVARQFEMRLTLPARILHKDARLFTPSKEKEYRRMYFCMRNNIMIARRHYSFQKKAFVILKAFRSLFNPKIDFELRKTRFQAFYAAVRSNDP